MFFDFGNVVNDDNMCRYRYAACAPDIFPIDPVIVVIVIIIVIVVVVIVSVTERLAGMS